MEYGTNNTTEEDLTQRAPDLWTVALGQLLWHLDNLRLCTCQKMDWHALCVFTADRLHTAHKILYCTHLRHYAVLSAH